MSKESRQPWELDVATAEREFARAWLNPAYTQIELKPIDVNRVLREAYTLTQPLTFTRAMLWVVEVRKARDPQSYIPSVVQEGQIWNRRFLENGDEVFLRASRQRQWLSGQYGMVLEETHVSHDQQRVIFLGRAEVPGPTGVSLHSDDRQPLFHVEHAVGGTEAGPLNLWRIVHLTHGRDRRLIDRFAALDDGHTSPEFIELYIGATWTSRSPGRSQRRQSHTDKKLWAAYIRHCVRRECHYG
jgi:hypothetical protein